VGIYRQAVYVTKEHYGYHYYLLYFMKEIRYNVNQSVWIADGERKGDCERREGAARTRKRCAFKDSVSYVPALTTISAKTKIPAKKTTWFLSTPPPPPTWFDVVLQGTPLIEPRGLCTVPNKYKSQLHESSPYRFQHFVRNTISTWSKLTTKAVLQWEFCTAD